MNRYSQLSTSQFNPLSMQEIFTVPLAKQQKHNQAQTALDELGLFDINRLQQDDELATGYINDYTSKIDNEIDQINQSGINNQSIGRVKALARERDKWLKQGDGKKVQDNYNAYVANKEQLNKLYEKGDISADKYQLGLQSALDSYKGVSEGGSYNSFAAVADTDYVKEALTLAQAVPLQEREAFLVKNGYQLTPDGSMYIHGETGRKFTEPQAIADIVLHGLGNNSNVMADLKQREQLGLFGSRTAQDVLTDLASTMERDLSVDNNSLNTKLTGNKGYNADDQKNNTNPVYNERGSTKVKVFDDNAMSKLSKIGTESKITSTSSQALPGVGGTLGETKSETRMNTLENSNLRPEEINKLQSITKSLFQSDSFVSKLGLKNDDITDPDTLKKVISHVQKYQDHDFSVNVVNPNSTNGNMNSLPLVNTKLRNASTEYIKTEVDAGGIILYDTETGEPLSKDDTDKFDKFVYSGYYPADNMITNLKGANQATMVSPGEVIAYDENGKSTKLYSSRPTSDMDKPEFRVAKMIKDIKLGVKNNLGGPTAIAASPELSFDMQGLVSEYDIDTNTYSIRFNQPTGVDENNNIIYNEISEKNMSPAMLQSYLKMALEQSLKN